MFDIGWSELLLIGIVALIAIGPKELPGALRTLGQWMGKLRRMASEFQGQFQEAMREAELADLKKQVDEMTTQAQSYANFDPVGEVRKEFESTQQQIESAMASQAPADTASPLAATETGASSTTAPTGAETTIAPSPVAPSPVAPSPVVASPIPEVPSTETPGTPAQIAAPSEPAVLPAAPDAVRHDAGGKPA
jgi:sec-independent protein translocase protein TatB